MNLSCQVTCLSLLKQYAETDRHSVLIEGSTGCGKSYCVQVFAQLLAVDDVIVVPPTVSEVKAAIDSCYNTEQRLLLCIDNLDKGVAGASYALLKFLEEPKQNVYVVVTCNSSYSVPSTILSRSVVATIGQPTSLDFAAYAKNRDENKYLMLHTHAVWAGIRSFQDIDYIYAMTASQQEYFNNLHDLIQSNKLSKDSVSSIMWLLGHYPDNAETNLVFVMQFLLGQKLDAYMQKVCIHCLTDLQKARIASHVVLAKLAMELKYGG